MSKYQAGDMVELKAPFKPPEGLAMNRAITLIVVRLVPREELEKVADDKDAFGLLLFKAWEVWEGFKHGIITKEPRRRSDGVMIYEVIPYDHDQRVVLVVDSTKTAVLRAYEESELQKA